MRLRCLKPACGVRRPRWSAKQICARKEVFRSCILVMVTTCTALPRAGAAYWGAWKFLAKRGGFWGTPMQDWYDAGSLRYDGTADATISSPDLSEYVRPHEKNLTSGNPYKDGLTWRMAYYLEPLPIRQFLLTADDYASVERSPLYQNPYWPTQADMPAEK